MSVKIPWCGCTGGGSTLADPNCKNCMGTGANQALLEDRIKHTSDKDDVTWLSTYLYRPEDVKEVFPSDVCAPDPIRMEKAVLEMLYAMGEDPFRDGLKDTPARVARMFLNETCAGVSVDISKELTTTFEASHDEVVLVKDIPFWSMCEHHLVPFFGEAHIAYIPQGRVVGISKLARCLDMAARRPNIQEKMTQDVANAINDALQPLGVAVIISAEHLCMTMRGIKKPGAKTVTSVMLGAFRDNSDARAELMTLVYGGSR